MEEQRLKPGRYYSVERTDGRLEYWKVLCGVYLSGKSEVSWILESKVKSSINGAKVVWQLRHKQQDTVYLVEEIHSKKWDTLLPTDILGE
jgi:hypothetical protein